MVVGIEHRNAYQSMALLLCITYIDYSKMSHCAPKREFKLFDTLVGSVLSYACEVWGFHGAPDIERIHSQFCRYLLGVKKSTNIAALHTELGRLPMIISRKLRILRYWFKIINTENVVVREIYNILLQDVTNGNAYNGSNWAYQVKSMLENLGFNYIWHNQAFEENSYSMIKQRLFDTAKQDLLMQIIPQQNYKRIAFLNMTQILLNI